MNTTFALGPGTEPIPTRSLDVRHLPMIGDDPPVSSYQTLLAPRSGHLRLSASCQLACPFCERVAWGNGDKDPEADMTLDVWEAFKEKFLPSMDGVELAGLGEPTIHPNFAQIVRETLAMGKIIYFPTNGLTLGSKPILDALGDGTNVRVSVSLDAWDSASYDRIRANDKGMVGNWDKILKAVRTFRAECPKAFLHSQYTAGIYNIDGFPQFMEVAAELGIQEVILRFVQAHSVAREDVSLRFAKDRTEAALNAAWLIANEKGVTLHAERRPYSASNPNLPGDTATDATSKLKRYTDFVPMSDGVNCPPPCTTITNSVTVGVIAGTNTTACGATAPPYGNYSANGTGSILTIVCGTCTTITTALKYTTAYSSGDPGPGEETDIYSASYTLDGSTKICGFCTTGKLMVAGQFNETSVAFGQTATGTMLGNVTNVNCAAGGTSTVITQQPGCSPTCSFAGAGDGIPIIINSPNPGNEGGGGGGTTVGTANYNVTSCCATDANFTPHCCFTTIYTDVTFSQYAGGHPTSYRTSYSGDPGACPPAAMSEGGIQIIRSVKVPRTQAAGQFVAQSVDDAPMTKPVMGADASLIVWADGELTSCFARHKVGSIESDTWESVILNPRYQAFLQNRQNGNIAAEGWCRDCPRVW